VRPLAGCRAFTLLEVLLAIAISVLLWLAAMPAYRDQILRTHRALARAELLEGAARQEQFYADHKRYAASLAELGFPGATYGIDRQGNRMPAATDAIYQFRLSVSGGSFILYGEPRNSQSADDRCGTLSLSSLGVKGASGSAAATDCW